MRYTPVHVVVSAGEPLPIHSGRRSREIIQMLWPAEQTLVARASCEKDRAEPMRVALRLPIGV
jgi:hypothetical protein